MKSVKRIFMYLLGMFILSYGIAVAIKIGLGVTPVSAIPYVLSVITGRDQGEMVTAFFFVLILIQFLILGKDFGKRHFLQFISAVVFGAFVDLALLLIFFPIPESYFVKLLLLGVSIFCVALGVILYLLAEMPPMPPEGVALAVSHKTPIKLHNSKIMFDSLCVVGAVILSLIFLKRLEGVREGTILSALSVGKCMALIQKAGGEKLLALKHWVWGIHTE